ncbi:MAG: trigger factor [Lentisphaerae bacterium GWF2_57_35]|nr:MAG: trigger factor [Lentisphaerae bacterium GWF2_57_35]
MNVTVEDAGACRKVLKIQVPVEKVGEEYESIVSMYSRAAKIPGFRPGKAPKDLVKRRYAKEIEEELNSQVISSAYREALTQEKISPVSVLSVTDVVIKPSAPASFTVMLDVPPQFELPKYKGMELKSAKADVTDQEVEDTIRDLREQSAKYEVVDRPVQKGDMVMIDYKGVCDGQPVEELAPAAKGLGQGVNFWVRADENEFLPGIAQGLQGLKTGDKKDIPVDFSADFQEKAVAGKQALYSVEVKNIREKKLPEIDEAFLKTMEVDSVDALKARVRTDVASMKDYQEKRRLKDEIVKTLLEKTALDVPESVVQEETRNAVYDIVRNNTSRGIPREQIEEKKGEIFEIAARNASDKVKMKYILHRIAEAESIATSEDDLAAEIHGLAARYGMPEQALRAELEKRETLDQLVEDIRIRKTVDFILEQAVINE